MNTHQEAQCLLSIDEQVAIIRNVTKGKSGSSFLFDSFPEIAWSTSHAQLKKVIKYLSEPCTEHWQQEFIASGIFSRKEQAKHRKDCPECWQELTQ